MLFTVIPKGPPVLFPGVRVTEQATFLVVLRINAISVSLSRASNVAGEDVYEDIE